MYGLALNVDATCSLVVKATVALIVMSVLHGCALPQPFVSWIRGMRQMVVFCTKFRQRLLFLMKRGVLNLEVLPHSCFLTITKWN